MCLLCWLTIVAMLIAGIPGDLPAQPTDTSADATEPWHISADRIQFNQEKDQYEASGNVTVTRQGRKLTADTVLVNQKSQEAVAQGNVTLFSGKDILTASRLQMNLETETGQMTDGSVFFSQNHLYISGDQIRKTGPQSFWADRFSLTSCDGPDPDWRITGKDLKITVEGYGFARHAAMWAGKAPVLYTPFLAFPAKLKRQSGVLMPELGYATRKGGHYLQPVYWAINDSSDATFFGHYMTERGTHTGLEYRFVLSQNSFGTAMAEGFQDLKIDDGQGSNSKQWGYEDDDALRLNKDRYWVRMKQDQALFLGLNAKLDIDIVSDQDYLQEFHSGINGFEKTRNYFIETFGRTLDDKNDPIRLNQLNINRTWSYYSFNTNMLWYDDVIQRRRNYDADNQVKNETNQTLQQLPEITFNGVKQQLAGSPVYYDLTTEYVHFYRINGTRGQRTDLYPRIYYPVQLFGALSVEPSAGLRHTAWRTYYDDHSTESDQEADTFFRNFYDFKLDLNTELYRIYKSGTAGSDRIKHSITPQIIYEFTPDEDQSDLPDVFDSVDRIERKNLLTYNFTNIFTARQKLLSKTPSAEHRYISFLRFKLEQSFDINKHNEDNPEPFSAINAELDLAPGRYVSLDADAQWSIYDNALAGLNTGLSVWNDRGDRIALDYRFTQETEGENDVIEISELESVRLSALWQINQNWHLNGAHERNLFGHKDIETRLGIGYRSQCWGVDLDWRIADGNQSYEVKFNLLGLGSFGN